MAEVHDGATLRAALLEIASDFSFTWIAETRLLFDALEPRRFAELQHNPTALLSELTDRDLDECRAQRRAVVYLLHEGAP